MLKANKSKWFEKLFTVYNRNLLKRYFNSFQIFNVNPLPKTRPQIIYLNHSSWWDGLIAFEISKIINADSYFMMEEKQLTNLRLFRRLGAFSVVRENPREAVASLNYAVSLLMGKSRRTLWIFPQGKILPNDSRPLIFFHGLARIVEKVGDCSVVPCAIRYEFLGHIKPEIFVRIGEPQRFISSDKSDRKKLTSNFESRITETLDALKQDIISGSVSEYKKIFNRRENSNLK